MSKELYSQIIGPLNKGVNQQADSFVLPGFAKVLENANCDLVEGLKKRLGSVPLKRIDTLTQNKGGNSGSPGIVFLWQSAYTVTNSGDPYFPEVKCFGGTGVTTNDEGTPTAGISLSDFSGQYTRAELS